MKVRPAIDVYTPQSASANIPQKIFSGFFGMPVIFAHADSKNIYLAFYENSVLTYKKQCGIIVSLPIRMAPDVRPTDAGVAKLADAPDLGSGAVRREGSSPFVRTILCGSSSFGRAPPCQGGGGGFEPRLPLHYRK